MLSSTLRKSSSTLAALAAVFGMMLGMSQVAHAQKTTVLRVVRVQTDDVAVYLQGLEHGKSIMKKLGLTNNIRVWRAQFAGPDAGSVVVAIEYPDMASFAAAEAKTSVDAEYQEWLKSMLKIRKVVSDSIYREM
jgi:ABC-type sugar transport system substrate-binding protein